MPPPSVTSTRSAPWWEQRLPSTLAFLVVLVVVGLVTLGLAARLGSVMGDVGRDAAGTDPWTDPIGIERTASGFLVAHVPSCAQAPVERIALWDGDSRSLWEVAGPPTPLTAFVIGETPPGFHVVQPFRPASRSALLRVIVVRRLAGVAGGRFRQSDLPLGKVALLINEKQHVYTSDGFTSLDICGPGDKADNSETGTTIP